MPSHAIAIIGMAGRFPHADDLSAFWRLVSEGVECLEELSDADLLAAGIPPALLEHPLYVKRGTFIERAEWFDAGFFGLSPREAQVLDPQQRVFLECAWEAIEHAGYAPAALPDSVGVYAGTSMNTYLYHQLLRNPALAEAVGAYQMMLGNDKDFLATRVSYKLALRGPSMTIQTACSTSLVAVQVACRALQHGECDMALAGGVSISFPLRAGYLYQEGMILSPDAHCRPFDAAAQGTRAGAGAGIVVLKPLARALADGDTVHAVIRGIAVNNDGAGKAGFTAPSVDGQVEVIATAQALAGINARSIGYMEAHGTATPLGDPIEIAALTQAFGADTDERAFCRLGSLKANLGHLDAAAGVAGLIKTALVLQRRELPPLVNFKSPNPALQLPNSPFYASAVRSPWESEAGQPRRAGVSSFGIGGTNAHAVLEEAPALTPRPVRHAPQLLVWSARSATALESATQRLAEHLQTSTHQALADVAFTLQTGRHAFAERRALVVADSAVAMAALRDPQHPGQLTGRHEGGTRGVAFLFSGQGSQHTAMGHGLYGAFAVYREAVDSCAKLLEPHLGCDIRALMFELDQSQALNETRHTQPALFVTSYALTQLWRNIGVLPQAMLGHSIGEYVAAHLAGVLSLEDALFVVAERGRLMQQMPPGRMAAVLLAPAELSAWLGTSPGVEIAAINAPQLCTLAGPVAVLDELLARMQSAGIDARALHTSHAFHSAMMDAVLTPFNAVLSKVQLNSPTLPYISNLTGNWVTPQQATSPAYYAEHLRHAVQFEAGLRQLTANSALQILEIGPGNALTMLARANLGAAATRRVVASMRHLRDERKDAEAWLEAVARLWLAGVPVQWRGLHTEATWRVPLPTYPFERQRHSVEPAVDTSAATAATANGVVSRSARIEDWIYAPTWSRDDSTLASANTAGRWLVLGSGDKVAVGVCDALRDAGVPCAHIAQRPADPPEDLIRCLNEPAALPVVGIINLWSLPTATGTALDAQASYDLLVALATNLPAQGDSTLMLLHATAGGESVSGEPVREAAQALAMGPVLVLPTEVPGLRMRSVDLPCDNGLLNADAAVAALLREVRLGAIEPQVAWRSGCRWVRRYERIELPAADGSAMPLRPRGAYLITGGLGGMGLTLARWLGRDYAARLLLTSRQGLPPREDWDDWLTSHAADERGSQAIAAIRYIEASGGEVCVAVADAADEASMAGALAHASARFGALHGVIHAAGIAGHGKLAIRTTAAEARAVIAPKRRGLEVLTRLLGARPLDFVALMSSINAVAGAPGACDYAAANAVFDAFVDSAERPRGWRQVVAVDWGAWRDVGMAAKLQVTSALRGAWQTHLAGAIAPADGAQAFARVLASGRRRVVVETYDVVHRLQLLRRPAPASAAQPIEVTHSTAPGATDRPALSTSYAAPTTPQQQRLAAIWHELLGVQGIGIHDDFFELGGHSLMATRVLSRIAETFGARLNLRDIFDAPTIAGLATRLRSVDAAAEDREELEF